MSKRFIIEIGMGVDLHGMNQTKAAQKAIKNAMSNNTLIGLSEVVNFDPSIHELSLKIKVATPNPKTINLEELKKAVPTTDNIEFEVVEGGLMEEGTKSDHPNETEMIVVVNAAITVYINNLK